jgi:hypothetical protein
MGGYQLLNLLTVLSAEMGRRKLGEADDERSGDRCDARFW